ncbi:glutathione S-transferase [Bauldia litoralis]|uniref:Glutathione S-transferase n=1 Tax=Bauldia litoralis TaxID=665467 RepID=A0A1G6DRC0_9HYPH|nr:glutathione S-transferase [Bauldia litoralis]SDB47671.1 glutathione S-transferase [Bauldia litoralis]
MPDLRIYIGYRTVSSWSLRAWLPLTKVGVPFEETLIRYRLPEHKQRLVEISPTGKVPLLVHHRDGEEIKVWDSIAIGEYLADTFPEARLWPADPVARAFARSISAEMHNGFRALREHLPMALLERTPKTIDDPEARADIARVAEIWRQARDNWGRKDGGPWLFGHYTVADGMYAPIVTRFRTYGVTLDPICEAYMEAVCADADLKAWEAQAEIDPPQEPLIG